MSEHYCSACGQPHGVGTDPAIEVARINAERDVAVAKLQARQSREANEHYENVETIRGETQVAVAVETDPPEIIAPPGAEPVIVEVETEADPIDELPSEPEPPETDGVSPMPPKEKKRKGWWDGYSAS